MPDYKNGQEVAITLNTWRTVDRDCFVCAMSENNDNSMAVLFHLKDEEGQYIPTCGKTVAQEEAGLVDKISVFTQAVTYKYTNMVRAFIPKGYSYQLTTPWNTVLVKVVEYPLKGAI